MAIQLTTGDLLRMEVRTRRPGMTPGRAAMLKLLEVYKELNYGLSRIEVQKLAYFLQEAGEPLSLIFVKHQYGPYADALRHALNRMEGHFIRGVGDGVVEAEIEPIPEALAEADRFVNARGREALADRIGRVRDLIEGYQSPYGMELLASVHWVRTREGATTTEDALTRIRAWNDRKKALMAPAHVRAAWRRLDEGGWAR
jgi:hypothetical protein